MEFEFDPRKSQSNREKHGIDFVAAQTIWEDPALLEFPARTLDEPSMARHWAHWAQALVSRDHPARSGHPTHLRPPITP